MKTRVSLMLGLMVAVVGARTMHAAAPHKTPPRTDGSHVTADDHKKKGDDDGTTGKLLALAPIPAKKHDGKSDGKTAGKLAFAAPVPPKKKDDKKLSSDPAGLMLAATKKKPVPPKKADGYLMTQAIA